MKDIAAKGFIVSVSLYAILHFFTYFYYNSVLIEVLSVLGLLTLVFGLLQLRGSKLQLPIFLNVRNLWVS